MVVVLLALCGGLVVSLLARGDLRRLGQVRVRRLWLLVAATAAQVFAAAGPLDQRWGLAVSAVAAAAFVVFNRSIAGLGLLALGFALNTVAVVANGGAMPVSLDAIGRIDASNGSLLSDPRHVAASSHTELRPLTDQIAVPFPFGTGEVLSVGDVLVAAGAGLVAFSATRRPVEDSSHGEEGPQAARTEEQQGQPRQAP